MLQAGAKRIITISNRDCIAGAQLSSKDRNGDSSREHSLLLQAGAKRVITISNRGDSGGRHFLNAGVQLVHIACASRCLGYLGCVGWWMVIWCVRLAVEGTAPALLQQRCAQL